MTRKALRPNKNREKQIHDEVENEVVNDPRFTKALSDPLFKKLSNEKRKVVLDDRFKAVLTDERFRILPGGNVDAYGRKIKRKSKEKQALNELKSYYTVEDDQNKSDGEDKSESEEEGHEDISTQNQKSAKPTNSVPRSDEDHLDYLNKLARGEISGEDSDESDDSDGEDPIHGSDEDNASGDEMLVDDEEYAGDYKSPLDIPGEEEEEVELGEATRRISILNCDWENIKSTDLMMILQSFCPPGKKVLSVTIYPSDFGKERMAEEAKYGPQSIWKKSSVTTTLHPRLEDEEGEEDDENEDLYEDIEDYGSDSEEEDQEEEEEETHKDKKSFGDFQRKKGAVGLIIHDDLKQRRQHQQRQRASSMTSSTADLSVSADGASASIASSQLEGNYSNPSHSERKLAKKGKTMESDIDEVALRQYELSKLRYYFAIAECDSIDTANLLYEQLDDVELGDTAMAIELRFVPDDLDLSNREIRDSCQVLPHHYKPPAFVINALQHTKVECSWDRGEVEREKRLTNISSWRDLKESELMQYIASSDSEDYEDEEEVEGLGEEEVEEGSFRQPSVGSIKSLKKKKRAKQLRKLLLGEDSGEKGTSKEKEEEEHDDFFTRDDDEEEEDEDDGMPQPDENGEITMTYLPEAGTDLLTKKQLLQQQQSLTPYEQDLLKMAEKKKQKKQLRKEYLRTKQMEQQQLLEQAKEQYYQKKKRLAPDDENRAYLDYEDSDRLLPTTTGLKPWEIQHKESLEKKQKKFAKKLQKQTQKQGGNGGEIEEVEEKRKEASLIGLSGKEIDTTDSRFQKVFEGNDANFGIDRTSTEFKATPAMEQLLIQQRQRREKKRQQQQQEVANDHTGSNSNNTEEVHSLANKLKRKFAAMK